MDSNKMREVVRLQQILKRWKNASKNTTSSKGINFLKRTLSFTATGVVSAMDIVPKGFLAVCVGKDLKRFIIPTDYLTHQAFQQEGVLKIPCQSISLPENIEGCGRQQRISLA